MCKDNIFLLYKKPKRNDYCPNNLKTHNKPIKHVTQCED